MGPLLLGGMPGKNRGRRAHGLSLVDAKDKELPAVLMIRGGHVEDRRWIAEMFYRPQKGQGEPAKLVYRGSKLLTIDVSFTLNNVKLADGKAPPRGAPGPLPAPAPPGAKPVIR